MAMAGAQALPVPEMPHGQHTLQFRLPQKYPPPS